MRRILYAYAGKKTGNHMVKSKQSEIEETVLLENYHGQILNNHNENTNFEIIEEINLIAGGR